MTSNKFEFPDYYKPDTLLTYKHKLVREATKSWIKKRGVTNN